MKAGSTVSIKCVITQSLEEPAYIFWYHNEKRVLDYDHQEKNIKTERMNHDTTIGTLTIFHATSEDAGNYTCSPSNLDSASVLLHVLNGKAEQILLSIAPIYLLFSEIHAQRWDLGVNLSKIEILNRPIFAHPSSHVPAREFVDRK